MITFDPDINVKDIVLVGVGGTGSQLARSISRMLYDMQQRNLETPTLHLVDHDVVELKNVGRQMFTVADVGRYKAEVLGERFSRALGLEIVWHTVPFVHDMFGVQSSYSAYGDKLLVVGAVDNHVARRALSKSEHLWIDCGNFFSSGQVVIGNTSQLDRAIKSVASPHRDPKANTTSVRLLPNAAALFPALLEPQETPQPDLSCADLVSMGEQHLLINDHIAAVAANYVFKLLHRLPIKSFISYVDLDGMNVKSIPITLEALQVYLPVNLTQEAAS